MSTSPTNGGSQMKSGGFLASVTFIQVIAGIMLLMTYSGAAYIAAWWIVNKSFDTLPAIISIVIGTGLSFALGVFGYHQGLTSAATAQNASYSGNGVASTAANIAANATAQALVTSFKTSPTPVSGGTS